MSSVPILQVVMYHYVRDLPNTRFPAIKGMLANDFRRQVAELGQRFEMATLESAMAFLAGRYSPRRDLCLLTFDDGLKEHSAEVAPVLASAGIEGVFFVITGCLEDGRVAPVHMNHFLMADMPFERYRSQFLERLHAKEPQTNWTANVRQAEACRAYPWDTPEVASFKYLFNFGIPQVLRDTVVSEIFSGHFGLQRPFARDLYVSWEEALQMQSAGMVVGGHTDSHCAISLMAASEMTADLARCRTLLEKRLRPQPLWPFSYPYGKRNSFTEASVAYLRQLGFGCSFSTEIGGNQPGEDLFCIHRVDCKSVPN